MPYPKTGNIAPHLAELSVISAEAKSGRAKVNAILDEIRPALIGQQVRRYGYIFSICAIRSSAFGGVQCYGVRVNRTGKIGTRGYDLGDLEQCVFLPSD